MKKKSVPLTKSKEYRKFAKQRDEMLEVILSRYLLAQDRLFSQFVDAVKDVTRSLASQKKLTPLAITKDLPAIRTRLEMFAKASAMEAYKLQIRLRKSTYLLANTSEAEAIARATNSVKKFEVSRELLDKIASEPAPSGGPLLPRLDLYYERIVQKAVDSIKMSMLIEANEADALERLRLALPKMRRRTLARRRLKPVKFREASKPVKEDVDELEATGDGKRATMTTGFVDDDAWNKMVDDYLGKELPGPRGPTDLVDVMGEDMYAWEAEQEFVQDFVEKVRAGENDAAKKNGYTDFMWIAVVDDKTDECCFKRDGLTSKQIEAKLEDEWKQDDCRATVAPAHFNCRCAMAPTTDELADQPEYDYGDADEWLNAP